jgi:hypothetical protein
LIAASGVLLKRNSDHEVDSVGANGQGWNGIYEIGSSAVYRRTPSKAIAFAWVGVESSGRMAYAEGCRQLEVITGYFWQGWDRHKRG